MKGHNGAVMAPAGYHGSIMGTTAVMAGWLLHLAGHLLDLALGGIILSAYYRMEVVWRALQYKTIRRSGVKCTSRVISSTLRWAAARGDNGSAWQTGAVTPRCHAALSRRAGILGPHTDAPRKRERARLGASATPPRRRGST